MNRIRAHFHVKRGKNADIALWSGDFCKLNGQAMVTSRVVAALSDVPLRKYIYHGGFASIVNVIINSIGLWWDLTRGKLSVLYLVCSRSGIGFVRDIPALLVTFPGVRVVVHVHGSDIVGLLSGRWYSWLARALYRRCELVVPSQHLVDAVSNLMSTKCTLCENFVVSGGPTVEGLKRARKGHLRVLWNSNVISSKGFFDVASAVGRLHASGHRIEMTAVGIPLGDTEMNKAEAVEKLEEFCSYEWLTYLGRQDEGVVAKLLSESDVVCLPSRYPSECQPLAVIQAMCSGKAIVVSDTPALRSTVGDYPASIVPVGSLGELVVALREFCEGELPPVSKEVQSLARMRFSAERFDWEMRSILGGGDRLLYERV